jgi:hypothetical protein
VKGIPRFSQRIVAPRLFPPNAHESCAPEVGQVPRSSRLRHAKNGNEVAHTEFTVLQQVEDPKPCAIGKRAEQLVDWQSRSLQHLVLKCSGSRT